MNTHPVKTITPEHWRRIEELYNAALERVPAVRPVFLAEACGADSDLRREVESLLAEEASRTGILATQLNANQLTPGSQLGPYLIEAPIGKGVLRPASPPTAR